MHVCPIVIHSGSCEAHGGDDLSVGLTNSDVDLLSTHEHPMRGRSSALPWVKLWLHAYLRSDCAQRLRLTIDSQVVRLMTSCANCTRCQRLAPIPRGLHLSIHRRCGVLKSLATGASDAVLLTSPPGMAASILLWLAF